MLKESYAEQAIGLLDGGVDLFLIEKDMIAVNKPSGLVIHPGIQNEKGTLANALVYHFDNLSDVNGENRRGNSKMTHSFNPKKIY